MACQAWAEANHMPAMYARHGCDAHHLLSGGIRRGHEYTIGLCPWHHRGVPPNDMSIKMARGIYGPSLMDGSKVFRAVYGTDDQLLERQNKYLEGVA